jgi:predicted ester cyclase
MSTKENKAIVHRYMEEFWNAGDLAVADEIIAADFCNHSPVPGEAPDREGLKQSVSAFHTGFSGPRFATEDMVAEGDRVALRGTFRGKHTGPFTGIPATDREIAMTWFIMLRIEGGKITDRWANFDELGFLTQLGALAPMGG